MNSKKKKKTKKRSIFKRICLLILAIILVLVIVFIFKIQQNGGGVSGIVTTIVGSSKEKIAELDDIYILCMGKSLELTDTIIVVKYSPKNQQASMLSVPRDSFVGKDKSKAIPYDKINCKYSESPQKTIDAVNNFTGLNIKYYITIDTKALRKLVDTIGGVYFDVPVDMDYDDVTQDLAIHIKKGYQLLNGEQAEGVVRFRHNNNGTSYSVEYGDNDLGRMKTQREFIKAVISQTMKVSNITKINELMNIAKEEVETNLSWDIIKDYIPALLNFNTDNLRSDMLPGAAEYCNGVSVFIVDTVKAKGVVENLFLKQVSNEETVSTGNEITTGNTVNTIDEQPTVTTKKKSDIKIEILNGTASTSKFNLAITQLKNQGYKITKQGKTNVTKNTIIIDRKNNTQEARNEIKSLLNTGTIQEGEDNNDVDFTIIIGQDY